MVKLISYLLCCALVASCLSGCALIRNPFKSYAKAESKVAAVEKKIDQNQDQQVAQGRQYVFAEHLVLQADPATNQFHNLQEQFNDKALAVLGQPTMEEINSLKAMVANLLATNQVIIAKGQKALEDLDAKVIGLQSDKANLEKKLVAAQEKFDKVAKSNAGLAQKWANVMRFVWLAIYAVIFFVIARVVTMFLPPPYNALSAILSVPVTALTKFAHWIVPEAKALSAHIFAEFHKLTTPASDNKS